MPLRRAGASARDTRVGVVRDFPRHACVPCHAPKHPKHFFRLLPYSTPPRRPTLKGLGAGRGRPRGFSAFWRVGRHGSASRSKTFDILPRFACRQHSLPYRLHIGGHRMLSSRPRESQFPWTREGTSRSARIFPATYLHAIGINIY